MLTRTEAEIQETEARLAALRARKVAEDAARADATLDVRARAVALHARMCTDDHPARCGWYVDPNGDDPERADWTEESHRWWLDVVRREFADMISRGWKLYPPGSSTPLVIPPSSPEGA